MLNKIQNKMRNSHAKILIGIFLSGASCCIAQDAPTIDPADKQIVPVDATNTLTLSATAGTCPEPDDEAPCPPWKPDGDPTWLWNLDGLTAKGSTTGDTVGIDQSSSGQGSVTVTQTQNWVDDAGNDGGSTTLDSDSVEVDVVKLKISFSKRQISNDLDGFCPLDLLAENGYTNFDCAQSEINITTEPQISGDEDVECQVESASPDTGDNGSFEPSDTTSLSSEDPIVYCSKNETGKTRTSNYLGTQVVLISAHLVDYPDVEDKKNITVVSVFTQLTGLGSKQDVIDIMHEKYSVGGMLGSFWYGDPDGPQASTNGLGITTVGDEAFSSEGWLASILEHENFHKSGGPLVWALYFADVSSYINAYNHHAVAGYGSFASADEISAWSCQLNSKFDLDSSEISEVNSAINMYTNILTRDLTIPPQVEWPTQLP